MKKLITIYVFLTLLIACPGTVFADLKVKVAKESELPYTLSPENPINSPNISRNSINNSGNSASNPYNLSSNSENNPSKAENGTSGNRRLLFEKDGVYYFIGYFVINENRLLNFFSPYGKRMFYTPSGSSVLFGSDDGEFCGALATINDKTVLMLTEKGQSALKNEGIPPFVPTDTNMRKSLTGMDYNDDSEHHIEKNYNSGSMIVLDDGSMWEIDSMDQMISALWNFSAIITVSSTNGGKYDYVLSNSDDEKEVRANYLGKK
jgi:hypothetical protein